jgi:three-Cys-motif partner protein
MFRANIINAVMARTCALSEWHSDMNRNILRHNQSSVAPEQAKRMDAFWGDTSWHKAAYAEHPGLFEPVDVKTTNAQLVQAFRRRLREVAGFKYVPDPMPMRNRIGADVYYLFFASPNQTGHKIVEDIFKKHRT